MNDETLQQLKRALLALDKMQARLEAAEREKSEPIAVLGLSCRFPGADGADAFWRLLREGRDATGPVPANREDFRLSYDPDPGAPGKTAMSRGGFLEHLDAFDHRFFKITPKEAVALDPQQRLLLEVTWEALERACIPPDQLFGGNTGVYIGACSLDFALWRARNTARERIDPYFATGTALSVNAGRLSYFLGLTGPAMTLDTACSSSLVAVHQACMALRAKECDLALVGGVSLLLAPEYSINFTKAAMLAADGRCKTFDAQADGFARAEGCGVIVLKRLSAAQAAGDPIRALILGSAVNQDGASGGLTVPSGPSQEAVIRAALHAARREPHDIDYLEAHGTGTPLGDPIEIEALNAVFRGRDRPLSVGSVKTNIGHCEAASGIAGLIKSVLAIESGLLPAHLHLRHANPHLDLDQLPIHIPGETGAWPGVPGQPRRAGVSAFGFSGTNAHVVLEQAPIGSAPSTFQAAPLFALSANDVPALRALAAAYAAWLPAQSDLALTDLCAAALRGRTDLPFRLATAPSDLPALARTLASFAEAGQAANLVCGEARGAPKVAFLFAGQGAQYPGMGSLFYRRFPVFRQALDHCAALAGAGSGYSLVDLLCTPQPDALLQDTAVAQPALFAFEYALYQLWLDHGVQPDSILGHSVGEFAAGVAAGIFSLEDGLRLVIERGRLMAALPEPGGMALIGADDETVAARLHAWPDLAIAALNGPHNTVIAGPMAPLDLAMTAFQDAGLHVRPLPVSQAFHAPGMRAIVPAFRELLRSVVFQRAEIPVVSCLTGQVDRSGQMSTPAYWLEQMLRPVRFAAGIQTLLEQQMRLFMELGPGADLSALGRQLDAAGSALWLPSLNRQDTEPRRFYRALSQLHVLGRELRQAALAPDPWPRLILPTYPFQRTRHWLPTEPLARSRDLSARQSDASPHTATPFFARHWEPASLPAPPAQPAAPRPLCLVGEQTPGAQALAAELRAGGRTVLHLDPGELLDRDPAGWAAALPSSAPCDWLYAAGMAATDAPDRQAYRQMRLLLHLFRLNPSSRWFILTQQAHAVDAEDVQPAATSVWGWAQAVHREYPATLLWLIDLDALSPATVRTVCHLIAGEPEQRLHAIRQGRLYHMRLHPWIPTRGAPTTLVPDAAYLVTGGFGALGTRVAAWLIDRGARRLILLGRNAPSAASRRTLDGWQRRGITLTLAHLDIAQPEAVAQFFQRLADQGVALKGVVHCAGSLADALLHNQSDDRYHQALAAKVLGSWNLHRQTRALALDFFLAFSSAVTLLGAPGQTNYAAANGFLDGLAHHRRFVGLPMLSVQWGPWGEGGMAGNGDGHWPMAVIEPEQAGDLLDQLLDCPEANVAVLPEARWPEFTHALAGRDWVAHLLDAHQAAPHSGTTSSAPTAGVAVPSVASQLEQAHPRQRPAILSRWLTQQLAEIMEVDDPASIDPRRGFAELGLDSLMATRLLERVRAALHLHLPVTTVFNYPTIDELAGHLLQQVLPAPPIAPSPPVPDKQDGGLVEALPPDEHTPSEAEMIALIAAQYESPYTKEQDG